MDRSNFIDRAIASVLVTEVLMSGADVDRREIVNCERNHIWPTIFSASAGMMAAQFNTVAAAASQGPRRGGHRASKKWNTFSGCVTMGMLFDHALLGRLQAGDLQ